MRSASARPFGGCGLRDACFRLHWRKNIGDCRPESHRRRHPHVPRVENRLPSGRTPMISYSSAPRSLLLAGALLGAFTLGAAAQQPAPPPAAAAAPAAAPLPPGSPLIGRPAGSEAAAKLAPI